MKILKPGKVEQRKFVCPDCECEFAVGEYEGNVYWDDEILVVRCPVCRETLLWGNGEPYEEPAADKQSDRSRLITVLHKSWAMDDEFADSVAQTLIANGVTFRENENET